MSEWVAVQKSEHKDTRWVKHSHYRFAQGDALVPVLLAELSELLPFYPLAFVATEEGFQLVALQSIQPGINFYLNAEGRWRVPYVPSAYRSHPFMLAPKNADEYILCLDQASEFVVQDGTEGEPLFNEQTELTESVMQILDFLQQCQANKKNTQQAVDLLAKHNLIVPWPIEQAQQEASVPVKGVYQIDVAALKQLGGEALAELNQQAALELAYAQLHSKPRLKNFEQLAKLHQQEQQQAQTAEELDLDQLFGEQDEDMFRF
ncbi:MAG: SapC family protein [Pseudomonadaceae bacterium]|nr:SapC family protein [Pseudomonadaceae bacterium]